jgi:hypothetical protein
VLFSRLNAEGEWKIGLTTPTTRIGAQVVEDLLAVSEKVCVIADISVRLAPEIQGRGMS